LVWSVGVESKLVGGLFVAFTILGACVKSAQFPFNSWLLAAIRAPTPISSLVHSSTLVVAGVSVITRYSYCLMEFSYSLKWLRLISLLLSGIGLISELDIKKLIAYSTIRHTSLILFILRLGINKVAFFHLNIHAIFKSMIFIGFGFAMLSSFHSQDRRIISYLFINPFVKILFFFSGLCLSGLPFLSGFYSKDFIIDAVIRVEGGVIQRGLFIIFLSIRVYYGFKLIVLIRRNDVLGYSILSRVGLVSLLLRIILILVIVNMHVGMVVGVNYRVFEFKYFVYLLILGYIIVSWLKFNRLIFINNVF